jgi:hypothetical protein
MRREREETFLDFAMMVIGIISAGALVVNWAFGTFESKASAENKGITLEKRLERIENKIDQILERARN